MKKKWIRTFGHPRALDGCAFCVPPPPWHWQAVSGVKRSRRADLFTEFSITFRGARNLTNLSKRNFGPTGSSGVCGNMADGPRPDASCCAKEFMAEKKERRKLGAIAEHVVGSLPYRPPDDDNRLNRHRWQQRNRSALAPAHLCNALLLALTYAVRRISFHSSRALLNNTAGRSTVDWNIFPLDGFTMFFLCLSSEQWTCTNPYAEGEGWKGIKGKRGGGGKAIKKQEWTERKGAHVER